MMGRSWNTYQLFALLTASMWRIGTEAGLDMVVMYVLLERRLRSNLIARTLQ